MLQPSNQMRSFMNASTKLFETKSDSTVIDRLSTAVGMEFSASSQYVVHAALLKALGFNKLAAKEESESKEEIGHANRFLSRVLSSGNKFEYSSIPEITIGSTLKEILSADLKGEQAAIAYYSESVRICNEANDTESAALFADILEDEKHHEKFLKEQIALLDTKGESAFK